MGPCYRAKGIIDGYSITSFNERMFWFDCHVVKPFYLQIAFTRKKDFGKEERELKWAHAQRTLHGLQPPETKTMFGDRSTFTDLNQMAEEAKRRADIAR